MIGLDDELLEALDLGDSPAVEAAGILALVASILEERLSALVCSRTATEERLALAAAARAGPDELCRWIEARRPDFVLEAWTELEALLGDLRRVIAPAGGADTDADGPPPTT